LGVYTERKIKGAFGGLISTSDAEEKNLPADVPFTSTNLQRREPQIKRPLERKYNETVQKLSGKPRANGAHHGKSLVVRSAVGD